MLYQWLLRQLGVMSIDGDDGPGGPGPAPASDPTPSAEPSEDDAFIDSVVKGITGEDPTPADPGKKVPDPKPAEPKPDSKPATPPAAGEIDLGEAGKVKQEDILAWKKSHDSYTQKAQEIAAKEEKLAPIIQFSEALRGNPNLTKAIIMMSEGAFADNGYNEEYIGNLVGALESLKTGKPVAAPGAAATPNSQKALIDQMKELDIDPDMPYGKLLLSMHGQLADSAKQIEALHKRLEDADKARQDELQQKARDTQQKTAEEAKTAIHAAFGKLTDGEGKLEFESDEERSVWQQMVGRQLAENNAAQKYKTIAEVTADVEIIGREQYALLQKITEARTAKALKGVTVKPQTPQNANTAPVESKQQPVTFDALEDTIIAELRQAQAADK